MARLCALAEMTDFLRLDMQDTDWLGDQTTTCLIGYVL